MSKERVIEQQVVVQKLDVKLAHLRLLANACAGCSKQLCCKQLFKKSHFSVSRKLLPTDAFIGQKFSSRINQKLLTKIALIIYGLPLLSLVVVFFLGLRFALNDAVLVGLLILSTTAILWLAKPLSKKVSLAQLQFIPIVDKHEE